MFLWRATTFMWSATTLMWSATKGYRLCPWRSPYLRWRMETWSGMHADSITARAFLGFAWQHRPDLWRYLQWAASNS